MTISPRKSRELFPRSRHVYLTPNIWVRGADADSVATAQAGIKGAQTAIGGIAKDLFTGQAASADLRDQVGGNLTSASDALNSITTYVLSDNLHELSLSAIV